MGTMNGKLKEAIPSPSKSAKLSLTLGEGSPVPSAPYSQALTTQSAWNSSSSKVKGGHSPFVDVDTGGDVETLPDTDTDSMLPDAYPDTEGSSRSLSDDVVVVSSSNTHTNTPAPPRDRKGGSSRADTGSTDVEVEVEAKHMPPQVPPPPSDLSPPSQPVVDLTTTTTTTMTKAVAVADVVELTPAGSPSPCCVHCGGERVGGTAETDVTTTTTGTPIFDMTGICESAHSSSAAYDATGITHSCMCSGNRSCVEAGREAAKSTPQMNMWESVTASDSGTTGGLGPQPLSVPTPSPSRACKGSAKSRSLNPSPSPVKKRTAAQLKSTVAGNKSASSTTTATALSNVDGKSQRGSKRIKFTPQPPSKTRSVAHYFSAESV